MSVYALLDPAVHAADGSVVAVAHALAWPGGGASVLAGVVALTVLVRTALLPVALRSVRAQRARAQLQPQLRQVRQRWAGDRARLAAETAAVYRKAQVSQLAGVGPALAQLPVLATLYRVVVAPTVGGHANLVLSASVLGGPLSAHWLTLLSAAGLVSPAGAGFVAVMVALGLIAWLSGRQAAARAAAVGAGAGADGGAGAGAQAAALSARLTRLVPFTTLGLALLSPMGVGFYLVVSSAWTLAERAVLPRLA
jgi:YidC/Oxa1 family membrane protein insertase